METIRQNARLLERIEYLWVCFRQAESPARKLNILNEIEILKKRLL